MMTRRRETPIEVDSADTDSSIAELCAWIRSEIPIAQAELLSETLEHLRSLFRAPRILLVWEEADEPWVNLASAERDDRMTLRQVAPSTFDPLIADRLSDIPFWTDCSKIHAPADPPIHPGLSKEFSFTSVLSLPLTSDELTGRIFLLDIDQDDPSAFSLGELAAAIVESRFSLAARQGRDDELELEDKIRTIARDLHDGLLQSFTGIVLHLESVLPIVDSDPVEARNKLTEIEALLMHEQRELRSYLESLREKRKSEEADFDMTGRLSELAERYHDQWGVEIEYRRDALDPLVRQVLGWETYRIITEAITNAIRHGRAKHVNVSLSTRADHLHVNVRDDGEGFPFRGIRTGRELLDEGMAPSSLTERVHSLNGEIEIESTDDGSCLEISIPIGWNQE